MKVGIGIQRKIIDGDRYTNLTSICCVYKEKIFEERSVHTNSESCNSCDLYREKNQSNSKQTIQILQPIIIDDFRRIRFRIKLVFYNIFYFFYIQCT